MGYPTETSTATDIFIAHLQVLHSVRADIQYDLPILYIPCWHLSVFIHLHSKIWCVSGIRTPFIDGSDQIGFRGRLVDHLDYLRMAFSAGVSASMKP